MTFLLPSFYGRTVLKLKQQQLLSALCLAGPPLVFLQTILHSICCLWAQGLVPTLELCLLLLDHEWGTQGPIISLKIDLEPASRVSLGLLNIVCLSKSRLFVNVLSCWHEGWPLFQWAWMEVDHTGWSVPIHVCENPLTLREGTKGGERGGTDQSMVAASHIPPGSDVKPQEIQEV